MISDDLKELLRKILFDERAEMHNSTYLFSCTSERKKNNGYKWKYNKLPSYPMMNSKLK